MHLGLRWDRACQSLSQTIPIVNFLILGEFVASRLSGTASSNDEYTPPQFELIQSGNESGAIKALTLPYSLKGDSIA